MKVETLRRITRDRRETFEWGNKLAGLLKSGDVVALYGELGSGKTVLAQGICEGLGVKDPVTSPSFTLVQEYTGRLAVAHFDFYRLNSLEEIEALDIDGYFERGGVSIVEWAEKGDPLFPETTFRVHIIRPEPGSEDEENIRELRMTTPPGRKLVQL